MKKIVFKSNFYFLLIAFLYSCSAPILKKDEGIVKSFTKGTVAVLPFDNQSNDITAETMLRDMVVERFVKKGWIVIKNEIVDEKLKGAGIVDGGQLNMLKPQEISKLLEADYLCYGYINDFKLQNLGFIINKKVELEIKIVDGKTEEVVFNMTGVGQDMKVYFKKEEAKKAFAENMALKLVQNIMKRPLYNESVVAVSKIFAKIP
ncbi:MAG: CsgG/HfaB family protein [Elusimicrobiota bacterium]